MEQYFSKHTLRLINASEVNSLISLNEHIISESPTGKHDFCLLSRSANSSKSVSRKNSKNNKRRKKSKKRRKKIRNNQESITRYSADAGTTTSNVEFFDKVAQCPEVFYPSIPTESIRLTIPLSGKTALFEYPDEYGFMTPKEVDPLVAINIIKESNVITRTQKTAKKSELPELTPLLPNGDTVKILQCSAPSKLRSSSESEYYILFKRGGSFDITYQDKEFKGVTLPHTLYFVQVHSNIIKSTYVVCTTDEFITPDTKIYDFPLPNVSPSAFGSVCWGSFHGTTLLDAPTAHSLVTLPDIFFSTPFTDHFGRTYNSPLTMLDYIKSISEGQAFDYDTLKDSGYTYSSWVNSILKRFY